MMYLSKVVNTKQYEIICALYLHLGQDQMCVPEVSSLRSEMLSFSAAPSGIKWKELNVHGSALSKIKILV